MLSPSDCYGVILNSLVITLWMVVYIAKGVKEVSARPEA